MDLAQGFSKPTPAWEGQIRGTTAGEEDATPHFHEGIGEAVRRLSRITSTSSSAPSPPPDGGSAAWLCGECEITSSLSRRVVLC